MAQDFGNAFLHKPPHKGGTGILKTPAGAKPPGHQPGGTKTDFHKNLPLGPAGRPDAGTGHGRNRRHIHELGKDAVDLRPRNAGGWHVMLQQIQGNRTHHYMLLADGKPVEDTHCDGMAVPTGAQELQFAIPTDRGPRVFMLFSQTK